MAKKKYTNRDNLNNDLSAVDCEVEREFNDDLPQEVQIETTVEMDEPATKTEEFKSYMVKVTSPALNVRSGPGMTYGTVSCIRDKGDYTIIEENNGWGKLETEIGWINLNYTKKI